MTTKTILTSISGWEKF